MTYPPQQPGPGGWGQQPAGNGFPQQVPPETQLPQQQPAWYGNQHAAFGQPQPAPVAPQWGGWEPGFGDVEPPKPKSRKPWLIGGVVVVVLAALIGGGAYAFFGTGPGEARPVAQQVVDRVNAHDFAGLGPYLCQSNRGQLDSQLKLLEAGTFSVRLGKVTEHGERASAVLSGSYQMGGATHPVDQTMGLTVEDGDWKVCQLGQ